jgi:uncharacterized protein
MIPAPGDHLRKCGEDVANEWPDVGLDVESIISAGWRATPFQQFIIKMHSRCNLACDYCYMYQMGDQSWSAQPMVMSSTVLERTCGRIAEHATAHNLKTVDVVLHGGEPLLAGPDALARVATLMRAALPEETALTVQVQTNGVLLNEAILDVFARHRIRVGVSLDGARETHDGHRTYANGRGSYAATARALELLSRPPYQDLFAGLLCVVDVAADPVRTYESLLAFGPPVINFLLPHGNWSTPPPGRTGNAEETPHGAWLVAAFERWFNTPNRETDVRLFAEIVNLVLGGDSQAEAVGLSPVALVAVNTDGSMEQVDTLRSTYHGAAVTGYNVLEHNFDQVLLHPAIVARQIGRDALSATCRQCEIHTICGGGYYPHRYRRGDGFRNPSVYCPDLTMLITHIAERVRAEAAKLLPVDHVSGGSMSQSARRWAAAAEVSG